MADISFKTLCKGQQRGIVCDKAVYVGRRWKCKAAEEMLIKKVDEIKDKIGKKKLSEYYIGKTFVDAKGRNLDEKKPDTWNLDGIKGRFRDHRYVGYNGLIFLTVIKTVRGDHYKFTHQDFALALEERLIQYYKIDKNDRKIKNENFKEGKRGKQADEGDERHEGDKRHDGYAVYIAVKLTEEEQGGQRRQEGQRKRGGQRRRRGQRRQ